MGFGSAVLGKPWSIVGGNYQLADKEKSGSGYTCRSLVAEFMYSRSKDLFKIVNYGTYWIGRILSAPSVMLEAIGKDAAHGKNWFSVLDLWKRAPELITTLGRLGSQKVSDVAGPLLAIFAECWNSMTDGLKWMQRYAPIGGMERIVSLNTVLTFFAFSYKAAQDCSKMLEAQTDNQKLLVLLNLAMSISYIVFSSVSLVCMALGTTPATVGIMGCLTTATVTSVAAYFFEKINDPWNRNADVNWDVFGRNVQFASA